MLGVGAAAALPTIRHRGRRIAVHGPRLGAGAGPEFPLHRHHPASR